MTTPRCSPLTARRAPLIALALVPVLALLASLIASGPVLSASAGDRDDRAAPAPRLSGPLVGEWRMTRLEVGTPGDLQEVPYSGRVIFGRAGTMAVQAQNPDEEAPDTAFTVNGYEAYYGPVSTSRTGRGAGTLTITVHSAAVRDLIGDRLTRNYEVTRDRLVLTPEDPADGFRVVYRRVR